MDRLLKIDMTHCSHCPRKLQVRAAIQEQDSIIRYLKHQGIDYAPHLKLHPNMKPRDGNLKKMMRHPAVE